ncbi:MAG: ABC transporter ATP-binding protein [Coriobacteriia bacterium]|nr:ABC transporter ATP-binding protein [Coriobacteriia bacterium]
MTIKEQLNTDPRPAGNSRQEGAHSMLEIQNLHFAYKKQEVLKGVDFVADKSECVCLLGENGAGKTTLFRCLLGLLRNYCGKILIDGVSSRELTVKETAKRIAYIPQAHAPVFNYSVFETVLMGTNALMKSYRTPSWAERALTEEMLELMGITHLAHRGYAEISGGERQLALIARALAQQSRILVMDEPTANLDYGNQFRVLKQVKRLAQQGYLIVLSTHNPEHALLFADRVLVLQRGRVALSGRPETVLEPEVINRVYGVMVERQTLRATWGEVPVLIPNTAVKIGCH